MKQVFTILVHTTLWLTACILILDIDLCVTLECHSVIYFEIKDNTSNSVRIQRKGKHLVPELQLSSCVSVLAGTQHLQLKYQKKQFSKTRFFSKFNQPEKSIWHVTGEHLIYWLQDKSNLTTNLSLFVRIAHVRGFFVPNGLNLSTSTVAQGLNLTWFFNWHWICILQRLQTIQNLQTMSQVEEL